MNVFSRRWRVHTPEEARREMERQIEREGIGEPQNLEEYCLKLFGRDIYEWMIKSYVERLWGVDCRKLPPDAIDLSPPRFTYDNRYYTNMYQGVPIEGYDVLVKRMLAGCDVMLQTDYMGFGRGNPDIASRTIFTGMIDEFFRFKRGTLGYRTVHYETQVLDMPDYQGAAVVDHIVGDSMCNRTIEHKHFVFGKQPKTVITREYQASWDSTMEPYFPIRSDKDLKLYNAYRALAVTQPDVTFCGRLSTYRHCNMDETIRAALDLADQMLK